MQVEFDDGPTAHADDVIHEVVGQIRQAQFRGRPLHASREITLEEARQSTLAQLRRRQTKMVSGINYHLLGVDSVSHFLWDEQRPLRIDQRRTNFWDDRPPTTEVILGRPLQSWALPDGMWRPFDMHPDTFKEWDHGCAVQMLYKSFTKRPSGAQQRRGVNESAPYLTVEQIQAELDECFVALGYRNDSYPFTHGWREDGVPGQMVIEFCKLQATKGRPVKCWIFHAGQKVAEFIPETATLHSPSIAFGIFGDHAFFYGASATKIAASKMEEAKPDRVRDEFTQRSVRRIFEPHEFPPFSEWHGELAFVTGLEDGFQAFAERLGGTDRDAKRRRNTEVNKTRSREFVVFWTTNIDNALERAIIAQTKLKGTERCFGIRRGYGTTPDDLTKLTLTVKDCPDIVLKQVGEYEDDAEQVGVTPVLLDWLTRRINLPNFVYRGVSYAGFGEQLRLAVARTRYSVAASTRAAILEKQEGTCAICAEKAEVLELDHIRAVADGGGNGPDNIQAICLPCHQDRSRAQRLTTFAAGYYSELSTDVCEAILDAPKPQQLVFGDGTKRCIELDVVKCRRWAIEKAEVPLPIACVLDDIVPWGPLRQLGGTGPDFIYIDAGAPDRDDHANFAAYQGPRWYTRELALWILQNGVCATEGRRIDEELHFIASFTASSHVEPDKLRASYADMTGILEDALTDVTLDGFSTDRHENQMSEADHKIFMKRADNKKAALFKKIFLSMQGAWLTQHHYSWACTDTTSPDDVKGQVAQFRELEDHRGTCRFMVRSETFSNRTMYLFGLYALNREHLLVCQAIRLTRNIPAARFCGIIGDGVLLEASHRAQQIIKGRVFSQKRDDGTLLFRVKQEDGNIARRDAPECKRLVRHVECRASPWRPAHVDEEDNLFMRFKPSSLGSWLQHPRFLYDRVWNVLTEEPGIGCGPDDNFQEEAAEAIFQNRGGHCSGRGGTGKSETLKKLRKKLKEAGWTVHVIAFTHVQSSNVEGDTVLHYIHQNMGCKRIFVIVDELSQVPLRLWAALATLKFTGARFATFGDIPGQLPPIVDNHREELWATLEHSNFLHDLCGGLRVELHKYRRGADVDHFRFVGSIYPHVGMFTFEDAMAAARRRYPVKRPQSQVQTALTLTNACRIAINANQNAHHAPADAVLARYAGTDASAQEMRLWPGLVLQAAITDRKHLQHALRYQVLATTDAQTELVKIDDEGKTKEEPFAMPTSEVPEKMRLTHAMTVDSSQARTLYGAVRLTQTSHPHMSRRRLIVALGRVPDGSMLEIE